MRTRRILIPVFGIVAAAALAVVGGWLAPGNMAEAQAGLVVPANVRAVEGPGIGQAVVSWDAVEGATGYTVQWVDLDAAWAAYDAGQNWTSLIQSMPVAASGDARQSETIGNLLANPTRGYAFRVRSRQDGATSGPSEWVILRLTVEVDAEAAVEILVAAVATIRHATALDAAGSVATRFGMTQESLAESAQAVSRHRAALDRQLAILARHGPAERVDRIRTLVNRLVSNIGQIQAGRRSLFDALRLETASRVQLTQTNTTRLFPAANASVDNQFYQLVTKVADESAGSGNPSENDVLAYAHTSTLAADVNLGHSLLLTAGVLAEPSFVARIRERYDSVADRVVRDVEYLRENPGHGLDPSIIALAENVGEAGGGPETDGYFERMERRLELFVAERNLIEANAKSLDQLLCEINALAVVTQGQQPSEICPPDDEATSVPGVTANRIEFGQSAAFTGPSRELGLGMRLGIQAAFNEANQAGGVNGRTLTLTTRNDGYEPDAAFANTRQLIEEEQVFALIGAVGTPTSRAASPVAQAAGVPFIAPFTGAQLLRDPELTNVLNLRASYHQETERMVAYLEGLEDRDIRRVAVLYQNDSYGQDGLSGVRQALDRRDDMELVESWYYRRNTSAVKSAVYRIAEEQPDAVIMVGAHRPTALTVELLREHLEPDPVFMSVSFVGSNALANELGDAGQGVYVTQVLPLPYGASIPLLDEYRAALSAYDATAEPGFVSLEGYLAGRLAIEGLERCGPVVTRHCFLDAVHNAGTINLGGFELMFGANDNQGSDAVFLTQIDANGQYSVVD